MLDGSWVLVLCGRTQNCREHAEALETAIRAHQAAWETGPRLLLAHEATPPTGPDDLVVIIAFAKDDDAVRTVYRELKILERVPPERRSHGYVVPTHYMRHANGAGACSIGGDAEAAPRVMQGMLEFMREQMS